MKKKLFRELTQGIKEAGELLRGRRKPAPLQRHRGKSLLKALAAEKKRERDL